ncbi:MAG: PilZ domain-containing protein, partial [Myxococcaceae bacterium]
MSKINNRRNVRVDCGAIAKAEGPRGPLRGVCRNISIGGLFFRGPTLPVGSSAELSIELPSGKIAAVGEVRYHHEFEDGAGMG